MFPKTLTAPSDIFYNFQPISPQTAALSDDLQLSQGLACSTAAPPRALPAYIKPLPCQFGYDDITYLQNKGALAIPDSELRNELLRSYAEYMHPFMPLLNLHRFVRIIDQNDGYSKSVYYYFRLSCLLGLLQ